jgi:hypothetical protein
MTTGFRLTLLCLVMLCLLLSLTQPAEFEHLLPIVGSGSWFAPHTESGTDAPTASVARSMQSSARAGPRQSLAEVRHGMYVKRPKSFRISSGYREVCTTF